MLKQISNNVQSKNSPTEEKHKILAQQQNRQIQEGSYKAYLFMILSNIFFVIMQMHFKQITHYSSPVLILGVRASITYLLNLCVLRYTGIGCSIKDYKTQKILIIRSLFTFVTVALYISAIKYIPIGIANALHNTSPIMAFFIQMVYYRRGKIQWTNLIVIVCCFSGILLITQPEFIFGQKNQIQQNNYIFMGMVLLAAFTSSFSMILLHDLRNQCHQLIALSFSYIFQGWGSYIFFLIFIGTNQNQEQIIDRLNYWQIIKLLYLILGMSLFAYLAQWFRVKSIFLCTPALVLPFNYLNVILGLLVDILIFNSHYNWIIIVGMGLSSAGLFSKFILLKINQEKKKSKTIAKQ